MMMMLDFIKFHMTNPKLNESFRTFTAILLPFIISYVQKHQAHLSYSQVTESLHLV